TTPRIRTRTFSSRRPATGLRYSPPTSATSRPGMTSAPRSGCPATRSTSGPCCGARSTSRSNLNLHLNFVAGQLDAGELHARGRAVVGAGAGVGRVADGCSAHGPGEQVAGVAAVAVPLQVLLAVRLHQTHQIRERVGVPRLVFVDVPQGQPLAGEG